MPSTYQIEQLKSRLAKLSRDETGGEAGRFTLGMDRVDAYLDPGPCLFCLHDIHAETAANAVAANAFALGLASRATQDRPLAWVFQNLASQEAGGLHGPGLHEWGLRPETVLIVRVRDATALLAAGEEALKSGAVGAVLMSGWGEAKAITLTASRRLALAARGGGQHGFYGASGSARHSQRGRNPLVGAFGPVERAGGRGTGTPGLRCRPDPKPTGGSAERMDAGVGS